MLHDSAETGAPAEPVAGGGAARPDAGCAPGAMPVPARIREWAKLAQPNARLIYGRGAPWMHCARSEVLGLVRALQAKGLVTSHFVRGREGQDSHHLLQRTDRPWLKGMTL